MSTINATSQQKLSDIFQQFDNSKTSSDELVKILNHYLLNLPSSQLFNDVPLKSLDINNIKILKETSLSNYSIDVRKIVGHMGHQHLQNKTHTWSSVLVDQLKPLTVLFFIKNYINNNFSFSNLDKQYFYFFKIQDKYYLNDCDGMHRMTLAKYLLSANDDTFLHDMNVTEYKIYSNDIL